MRRPDFTPGSDWWTGYPFVELGDKPHKRAEIRKVVVVGYDGDKYVKIKLPNGATAEVKGGYLFPSFEEAYEYEWGSK